MSKRMKSEQETHSDRNRAKEKEKNEWESICDCQRKWLRNQFLFIRFWSSSIAIFPSLIRSNVFFLPFLSLLAFYLKDFFFSASGGKKKLNERIEAMAKPNRLAYLFISHTHVTCDRIGCDFRRGYEISIRWLCVYVCLAIMKIILTRLCVRNQFLRLQLWLD